MTLRNKIKEKSSKDLTQMKGQLIHLLLPKASSVWDDFDREQNKKQTTSKEEF